MRASALAIGVGVGISGLVAARVCTKLAKPVLVLRVLYKLCADVRVAVHREHSSCQFWLRLRLGWFTCARLLSACVQYVCVCVCAVDKEVMGWGENDRGVSFTFGAEVVAKFLHKHDLDLICRAHQVRASSPLSPLPSPLSSLLSPRRTHC